MSVPLLVVGEFIICVNPWLDIKLLILLSAWCRISSLKSPRITHGMLDVEVRFNTLDSKCVNVCNGMVGDLYKSAIWICVLLANSKVVLTASIPLDAYLCVLTFIWRHSKRESPIVLHPHSQAVA